MAVLIGSFLGTMIIPAILLWLSQRRPGRQWLAVIAIFMPVIAMYGGAWNVDLGEILALAVTVLWAAYSIVSNRKPSAPSNID
jgi:drug/metabolite transporter (DMT)-like permease